MIYQLKAYYGALLDNKVVYSAELTFNDCTKPSDTFIDDKPLKAELSRKIISDGFNSNDFTFGWVTREQYYNKFESKVDKEFTISK